jgi:hypothetical protein
MVLCQGSVLDDLPEDCDALAEVFVKAAAPTVPFHVAVRQQGKQGDVCLRSYAADGSPLEAD